MKRVADLLMMSSLMFAAPAAAQSWELSALTGYVPTVQLDNTTRGVDSADIGGGFLWQALAGRMFSPRWGVEVLWAQQYSGYEVESNGVTGTIFDMTVVQLHGNAVYQFGRSGSRLQPFAFAGAGSTFLSATDLPSETKFSMGLGGGAKYFPWKTVGLRGQVRYKPTFLNDEDSRFCDPFGFCQSMLRQFEFAGGFTIRF